MRETPFTSDRVGQIDRRNLLRLTGGVAGGSLAVTAVASARSSNANGKGNGGGKSGGRGQTSSTIRIEEPFTVSNPRPIDTNASCMSDNSAQQDYMRYDFEYCDDDYDGGTICVIPEQSEVDQDRVYEFRSKQQCKAPSSEFQHKFSFGPSNSPNDC